jgi:SAM-dependent methyltransferase
MDKAIEMRLEGLARLSHTASAASAVPCKVCGGSAPFFDVVDFNKVAGETNYYAFGPSGVHVNYHRCGECGFLFTNFFDDWQTNDFRRFIYNPDYGSVDSEYSGARPRRTAERMANLLRDLEHLRVLDYGAGSGIFAECMVERGFPHVDGFDPFSQPNRPDAKFDVIVCNEVLEHSPDPLGTMRDMRSFLSDDGCIILGQSLQPPDIERVRASWWYCAPRNGHCSTFAERTLAIAAMQLGLLFHRGGTLLFRPQNAKIATEVARRVNSPGPFLPVTLGVPGAELIEGLHQAEPGDGRPFRWTSAHTQLWTADVKSDTNAVVQIRIPYLMEIEPGFAARCTVSIDGRAAEVSVQESSIIAEAEGVQPGKVPVALTTPEHKSPLELRGVPDRRKLGLALRAIEA